MRVSNLPKVTQSVSGRTGHQTWDEKPIATHPEKNPSSHLPALREELVSFPFCS